MQVQDASRALTRVLLQRFSRGVKLASVAETPFDIST
jgi:hypothetical protein